MTESVFIKTASFTKNIGSIKPFPYNLFDSFKGAVFEPWDKSTLFQDLAMMQPVTAIDQPVRVMRDMSGSGNHWVATSDLARPLYQEQEGKGFIRFNGTSHAMNMSSNGLNIFSGASSAIVLNVMNLNNLVLSSWKYPFRFNVVSGNTQLIGIDTTNGSKVGMVSKRVHADALLTSQYEKSNNKDLWTFDLNYVDGTSKTYKNQSEANVKNFASTGPLPSGALNGMFLGHFNGSGFASLDFHGGIVIAGGGGVNQHLNSLEKWLISKV